MREVTIHTASANSVVTFYRSDPHSPFPSPSGQPPLPSDHHGHASQYETRLILPATRLLSFPKHRKPLAIAHVAFWNVLASQRRISELYFTTSIRVQCYGLPIGFCALLSHGTFS